MQAMTIEIRPNMLPVVEVHWRSKGSFLRVVFGPHKGPRDIGKSRQLHLWMDLSNFLIMLVCNTLFGHATWIKHVRIVGSELYAVSFSFFFFFFFFFLRLPWHGRSELQISRYSVISFLYRSASTCRIKSIKISIRISCYAIAIHLWKIYTKVTGETYRSPVRVWSSLFLTHSLPSGSDYFRQVLKTFLLPARCCCR